MSYPPVKPIAIVLWSLLLTFTCADSYLSLSFSPVTSSPNSYDQAEIDGPENLGGGSLEAFEAFQSIEAQCSFDNQEDECGTEFVCVNSTCTTCHENDQCWTTKECFDGRCRHSHLFKDFNYRDVLGSICIFLGAMLAAGGGLGGGGVFVPVFILVVGFDSSDAIPLSQATIFGGSIVNMFVNSRKRHPVLVHRPLIDFDAILVLSPMLLAGTAVGVVMHQILPTWMVVGILAIVLILATYRTTSKGIRTWKAESGQRSEQSDSSPGGSDYQLFEPTSDDHQVNVTPPKSDSKISRSLMRNNSVTIVNTTETDDNQTSKARRAVLFITLMWLILFSTALLRGTKPKQPDEDVEKSIVGIEKCSAGYFLLTFGTTPLFVAFSLMIGKMLVNDYEKRPHSVRAGEIAWTERNALLYPALAFISGIMGGLLGIGGGMIIGPLLLELGLQTQVTAATSACAVFITASAAACQYIIIGELALDYGLWYSGISFCATMIGLSAVNHVVTKYKRSSLIILAIAGLLAVATPMMILTDALQIASDISDGKSLGLKHWC